MTPKQFLETRIVNDQRKAFEQELPLMRASSILNRIFSKNKLTANVASYGHKLLKSKKDHYYYYVTLGAKEIEPFREWISAEMWEKKENYALLDYFFGKDQAPFVKSAWHKIPNMMYQNGYARRSFRAPHHSEYLLVGRLNFLLELLNFSNDGTYGNRTYYGLNISEQVRFDNYIEQNNKQFMVWAAALDSGDQKLFQLFEDIIFNKDETGKVTRHVIKALLFTDRVDCWVLVGKLLLAAQRQEGLRQTILEALDETSFGALKHFVDVILEHKLTRFSSVVRAIDTWTGMGWDAEKEATVKTVLGYAQEFLGNRTRISTGLNSKNNVEVYMALWSQAVEDVQQTVPMLDLLITQGNVEKKCLAVYFASQTSDPYLEMPIYFKALENNDLQLLSFVLPRLESLLSANRESQVYINNPKFPKFFDVLMNLGDSIQVKEREFEGKVFAWMTTKFKREQLYACALLLVGEEQDRLERVVEKIDMFSVDLREQLARTVLKDYYEMQFSYHREQKKNVGAPSDFQKNLALQLLADRSENIASIAFQALKMAKLNQEDWEHLLPLYQRKSSKMKQHLTHLMWLREDKHVQTAIDFLLHDGDAEQRYSALDLMLQLKRQNRMETYINSRLEEIKSKDKLSARELTLLKQLEPETKLEELNEENGFGFYKPGVISPYELPRPTKDGVFTQNSRANDYGFSMPLKEIRKHIQSLIALYNQNASYEYEVEQYNGARETVLLGNSFQRIKYRHDENWSKEQIFANYPLHEVWEKWYTASNLQPVDLFLLTFAENCQYDQFKSWLGDYIYFFEKDFIRPFKGQFYRWNNPLIHILEALKFRFPFENKAQFRLDATANLYSKMPSSFINYQYKSDRDEYHYSYSPRHGNGWQMTGAFDLFLQELILNELSDEQIETAWMLYRWRQFSGLKENTKINKPPLYLYCRMFDAKKITEAELFEGLITEDNLRELTLNFDKVHARQINYPKEFPWLRAYIDKIQDRFLDIELQRGDSGTSVTRFITSFQTIHGVNRFVELVHGLGKQNLYRGYIYSWGSEILSRQQSFSYLLKRCYPKPSETHEDFSALVKEHKITEKRLIEAAMYAPQWQRLISEYLEWKGLDAGIWWMHAHTKTASYVSMSSELESEIARYSDIDVSDFQNGAVDKNWFQNAYKQLGKARWELLYEAAKYISEGNGHRRARLYSDTLTGDLKITEVTEKVKDKRDQDYLRVYGLVPLSRSNAENDVLKRYEYLLQFKKESKEFGAMRQSSEASALEVAFDNLARNAGYPDPIRLTWAMESKQVQQIFAKETKHEIEGYTLELEIDAEGKTNILVFNKEQKAIKAVPASLKKHKLYLELSNHKKKLNEQFRRSKKSLEEAMIRGDEFTAKEIINLTEHPVIQKHLSKLVLVSNEEQLFWISGHELHNLQNDLIPISDTQTFRIAHVVDFHRLKQWTDFQRFCFEKKLKQPFKQVFRELYIPTADELKEKSISRRYAGHQVQPGQTLALLKSRGWKVDYEDGLQKVFHKLGFQVKLYAMADWFSPADIEAPTLETIEFHSLRDYQNIPFEDIEPRIFSEVMRDVDLVVSVAHVGGVDPETSQSTVEMRAALVRETMRLFKQENVTLSERHALIAGKMSNYSVHLGSAVVHQVPGKYLSILPVHSQHRGRLFLPFADDDPKSAEVISKVLLLAQDHKIQDPTVLRQIEEG